MRAGRGLWALSLIVTISIGTFSPSVHAEPNPRAGKAIAGTCDACHGNNGIAVASNIPNLAGQLCISVGPVGSVQTRRA